MLSILKSPTSATSQLDQNKKSNFAPILAPNLVPNLVPDITKQSKSFNIDIKQTKPDKEVSDSIKLQIVKELVEPMYINDIQSTIQGKRCWRLTGQIFETMSKVLVAIGGIISFSSGYYNYPALGFIAGSISTVSLAMLQFSSFSYSENKKQSSELNILLHKLDIDTIPELDRQVDMLSAKKDDSNSFNDDQKDDIILLKKTIEELHDEKKKEIDQLKYNIIKLEEHIKSKEEFISPITNLDILSDV
jgi:hypothetical protein